MSEYGITKKLNLEYDTAVDKVKDVLENHGFGILSEIDVSEKFEEKLGIDFGDYVILGACNPELAHRAIQEEQELGLLLPCNVIVYTEDGETYVSAVRASQMLEVTGNEKLDPIAEEVESEFEKIIEEV